MPFFPQLQRTPLEDIMTRFLDPDGTADVPEDERPFWLEEAAVRLVRSGPAGLAFLLHCIPRVDEPRLRAILLALSFLSQSVLERNRSKLRDLLLSFLNDRRPMVVAGAVDTLRVLDGTDLIDRVLPLVRHRSPYVVGSALRFLSRNSPEQARPILLKALESDQPIIRQNAVDELDELNDVKALPRLRRLLADEDADVRRAAQTAVANLEEQARGK
jgi:hypothetical protein